MALTETRRLGRRELAAGVLLSARCWRQVRSSSICWRWRVLRGASRMEGAGEAGAALVEGATEEVVKQAAGAFVFPEDGVERGAYGVRGVGECGVGAHEVGIGAGHGAFDIGEDEACERAVFEGFGEGVEAFRVLLLKLFEGGAGAVPSGQVEACLGPGEDPGDGAQVFECGASAAACGAGADVGVFEGIDGSGLAVEVKETR